MFSQGDRGPGPFRRPEAGKEPSPVIRGNMHRAIVLRAPDETFAEAVFILKDDIFRGEGVSRKELLRQAGEAASLYCGSRRKAGVALAPAAVFLLGATCAIFALWAFGVL